MSYSVCGGSPSGRHTEHLGPRLCPLDVAAVGWPQRLGSRLDPFLLLLHSLKREYVRKRPAGGHLETPFYRVFQDRGFVEVIASVIGWPPAPAQSEAFGEGRRGLRTEQTQRWQRSSDRCGARVSDAGGY